MDIRDKESLRPLYELIHGSLIRGMVFSVYDKFGPQTIYSFPPPIKQVRDGFGISRKERMQEKLGLYKKSLQLEREGKLSDSEKLKYDELIQTFTERDYLQIAIKSVSLLIGEKIFDKDPALLKMSFFGVIPYPDMDIYAYTFFRFYTLQNVKEPKACTFSLLIDNTQRSYIYDNSDYLRNIIKKTTAEMIELLDTIGPIESNPTTNAVNLITNDNANNIMIKFLNQIKLAEVKERIPLTSTRQIKVVFCGMKGSGKTSYLLTINRRYSELIRRDSFNTSEIHLANLLGMTIVNWNMDEKVDEEWHTDQHAGPHGEQHTGPHGEQHTGPHGEQHTGPHGEHHMGHRVEQPVNIETRANIYLYDANLIFYFVNITDMDNIDNSRQYFRILLEQMDRLSIDVPIIIILSKVDYDIKDSPLIRESITSIKGKFSSVAMEFMRDFTFFETSIFDLSSILYSFSYGIGILNPNRELTQKKLQEYAEIIKAKAILIFNENGLIISDYINDPEYDIKHDYKLQHVLETTGNQYIEILKNFDEVSKNEKFLNSVFKKEQVPLFKTRLDDGHILYIKRFSLQNTNAYLMLLIQKPEISENKISKYLDKLVIDFKLILEVEY